MHADVGQGRAQATDEVGGDPAGGGVEARVAGVVAGEGEGQDQAEQSPQGPSHASEQRIEQGACGRTPGRTRPTLARRLRHPTLHSGIRHSWND